MIEQFKSRVNNLVQVVQGGGSDVPAKVEAILIDVHHQALEGLAEDLHRRANKAVQDGDLGAQQKFMSMAALARSHKNPNHQNL